MRHRSRLLPLVILAGTLLLTARAGTEPQPQPDPQRQAVGGLAAVNVYSLHGCIGLAADAYQGGVYDAGRVQVVLDDLHKIIGYSVGVLRQLQPGQPNLSPKVSTAEMIALFGRLDAEVTLLGKYVQASEKDKPAALQQFTAVRAENWKDLSALLGLNNQQDPTGNQP